VEFTGIACYTETAAHSSHEIFDDLAGHCYSYAKALHDAGMLTMHSRLPINVAAAATSRCLLQMHSLLSGSGFEFSAAEDGRVLTMHEQSSPILPLLLLLLLLLPQVRSLLSDSGFEFSAAEDARVLTGKEEGLWGWLAVNYATGALQVCLTYTVVHVLRNKL
jgi:hypothetical protein